MCGVQREVRGVHTEYKWEYIEYEFANKRSRFANKRSIYPVEDVNNQYVAYSIGAQYWLRLNILTLRESPNLYPEGLDA